MITLQTRKQVKKSQIAYLLDVDLRTVQCVTRLEAETGSVVWKPVVKGPWQILNGIDCVVCGIMSVVMSIYWTAMKYLELLLERTPWPLPMWTPEGSHHQLSCWGITWNNLKDPQTSGPQSKEARNCSIWERWGSLQWILDSHLTVFPRSAGLCRWAKLWLLNWKTWLWVGTNITWIPSVIVTGYNAWQYYNDK